MAMQTLQVRLTDTQLKELDELVEDGIYSSKGEAIRDAVRRLELIYNARKLRKIAKQEGLTRKDIMDELEKVGRQLYEKKIQKIN